MSPVRRPGAAAAALPAPENVNIGEDSLYSGGGGIPEGDYALEFIVRMSDAVKQDGTARRGGPRLGVQVNAYPLSDPTAEPYVSHYSFGSKAHLSFSPNPVTGKGVVAIPGGPASTLPNSTNWAVLRQSLYDSGLPKGIFVNDFSVLDGIWVHMTKVEEPAERKGFQSQTGEAAEEQGPRTTGYITVVSEIKEEGKPWEGTGGIPSPDATPAPKPNGRVAARPAVAAPPAANRGRVAPAPAPVAEEGGEMTDAELRQAATDGMVSVLEQEANANGCTKIALRTGTFKSVSGKYGNEVASAVQDLFLNTDANLNSILGPLGYAAKGVHVVVAE